MFDGVVVVFCVFFEGVFELFFGGVVGFCLVGGGLVFCAVWCDGVCVLLFGYCGGAWGFSGFVVLDDDSCFFVFF